jgi:hypothetical protein
MLPRCSIAQDDQAKSKTGQVLRNTVHVDDTKRGLLREHIWGTDMPRIEVFETVRVLPVSTQPPPVAGPLPRSVATMWQPMRQKE